MMQCEKEEVNVCFIFIFTITCIQMLKMFYIILYMFVLQKAFKSKIGTNIIAVVENVQVQVGADALSHDKQHLL